MEDKFEFNLVEQTEGPHKGKVWRSELMTREEAFLRNQKVQLVQWIMAAPPSLRTKQEQSISR